MSITVGEILDEVTSTITLAAIRTPIDPEALTDFKSAYYDAFQRQLNLVKEDGWNRQKHVVLAAATSHGFIAAIVANMRGEKRISSRLLMAVGALIEQECKDDSGQQGSWCRRTGY